MFATVMVVTLDSFGISPAHATPPQRALSAHAALDTGPDDCVTGTIDVEQVASGWTVSVDVQKFPENVVVGACVFDADAGIQSWSGSVTVNDRSVRMNSGLSRAEVGTTIPGVYFVGFHDIHFATLIPVNVTWNAGGKKTVNADGSVQRDGEATGTVAFCGTQGNPCNVDPACTPPPCTNDDTQLIAAFTAPGSLKSSG
jgi:hypothetical protein